MYNSNNDGNTPLFYAAWYGHFKICKLIIENVEDKNLANNGGFTPLFAAAPQILKIIMETHLFLLQLGGAILKFVN